MTIYKSRSSKHDAVWLAVNFIHWLICLQTTDIPSPSFFLYLSLPSTFIIHVYLGIIKKRSLFVMTFLLLYLEYKQTLFFSAAEIACRHTTCYEDIINSEKVPDFLPPSLPSSSELLSISQGFVKGQKKTVHLLASCQPYDPPGPLPPHRAGDLVGWIFECVIKDELCCAK